MPCDLIKSFNLDLAAADIPKEDERGRSVELHALRHTFASHLVMKGVSIYEVSQWLGHKSVNTTMIYAHLAPQHDEINVL